jgi:hypothetical protein
MENLPVEHKTRTEVIVALDGMPIGTATKALQREQQQYYAALLAAQEKSAAQQRLEKQRDAEATAARHSAQPAEMQPPPVVQHAGLADAEEFSAERLFARAMVSFQILLNRRKQDKGQYHTASNRMNKLVAKLHAPHDYS